MVVLVLLSLTVLVGIGAVAEDNYPLFLAWILGYYLGNYRGLIRYNGKDSGGPRD